MQYFLLSAQNYSKMNWKNGKGYTYEIAKDNSMCAHDRFNWRISMANIDSNGEFSYFPGYQRYISVLDGEGIQLTINDHVHDNIYQFVSFSFSGESKTYCKLLKDEVKDFNLIYDPAKCQATFRWLEASESFSFQSEAEWVLLFSTGNIIVKMADVIQKLSKYDSFFIRNPNGSDQFYVLPQENQTNVPYCLIEISSNLSS